MPSLEDDEKTVHILILSGGAWRGAVQYWVIVDLMSRFQYAAISGVSVGSINGVMAAMGKLDELLNFWKSIDGLKGYLSFRWFYIICWALGIAGLYEKLSGKPWMGGFYAMTGLHNKLLGYCKLDEVEIPFIAGVVSSNSGNYHSLDTREMRRDQRLALACLTSSCMSPFMTPPLIQLEDGGEREAGFDGGGRNIFPLPLEEIRRLRGAGKRVVLHAVGCMPRERIQKLPTIKVSGLIELALRGLEILEAEVYENDMVSDLRKAVGVDGEVHIWLPAEHPGGSFDAKPEDIERRLQIGKDMVEAGPALVLQGLPSDDPDEEEATDPGNLNPPKG